MKNHKNTAFAAFIAVASLGLVATDASAVDCRSATKLVGVKAADGTPASAADAVTGTADLRDGNGEIGQTLRIDVSHLYPNRAYRIFLNGKRVDLGIDPASQVANEFATSGAGNGSIVLGTAANAVAPLPAANIAGMRLEIGTPSANGRIVRLAAASLLCTPPRP
jgi:hypothetical protein